MNLIVSLQVLADRLNILEFPPVDRTSVTRICSQNIIMMNLCKSVISGIFSSNFLDLDMVPIIVSAVPAGCSIKQFLHYAQSIATGTFAQYDWGCEKNTKKYGSKTPQKYDMKKISFPVAIFFSENDTITAKEDVEILSMMLPNVIQYNKLPGFGHSDFVVGNDTRVLNKKILRVLKRYNGK
ncbi:hypothetical protein JTB14_016414 [Gonioctena quinquepunctata]|nr:hypothetical protein JTB14_016414 [Gonioctena quinquepunctata]